jgi:hypothetical protein
MIRRALGLLIACQRPWPLRECLDHTRPRRLWPGPYQWDRCCTCRACGTYWQEPRILLPSAPTLREQGVLVKPIRGPKGGAPEVINTVLRTGLEHLETRPTTQTRYRLTPVHLGPRFSSDRCCRAPGAPRTLSPTCISPPWPWSMISRCAAATRTLRAFQLSAGRIPSRTCRQPGRTSPDAPPERSHCIINSGTRRSSGCSLPGG